MIPAEILNDPMAQALMATVNTRHTGRVILFDATDPQWAERTVAAKWKDAYAFGNFRQSDRNHHLCCEQQYQRRDGFRMVEVATNIYGYVVRDTMNDGDGVLFGGRGRNGTTREEAIEWARQWHAEKPTHRMVVLGHERLPDQLSSDVTPPYVRYPIGRDAFTQPVQSLTEARKVCLYYVDKLGSPAWDYLIVVDEHGNHHNPADLWGSLADL